MEDNLSSIWATTSVAIAILNELRGMLSGLSVLKYSILYIITYYLIVLGGAGLLLFNGELSGELMVKVSRFL